MKPEPTPEQIKNLRDLAASFFGPWAYMMPVSDVMRFRDRMQEDFNALGERLKKESIKVLEPKKSEPSGFTLGDVAIIKKRK